jgi:hypothetical protein
LGRGEIGEEIDQGTHVGNGWMGYTWSQCKNS